MIWSIMKRELKKHKWINGVLVFFIMISTCLISAGVLIVMQLFNSINNLYDIAKPPHFLQMHTGEIQEEQIENFAASNDNVVDWQIIDMMNLDGSTIWVTKPDGKSYSLSDCMIGLGFITEPEKYDMLLNTENQPVNLQEGEIGVPIMLLDSYDIDIGDKITLSDGQFSQTFNVTTFLRDAQMNSTLCSSTRFLLNDNDFQKVNSAMGEIEYLIEFYFDDASYANDFQTLYENSHMPCEGQAITYTLLKLVSGLPDLITVVILILVSVLLTLIAGLCLRFTILAVLEEDVKEIGVMKAIGISFKNIKEIYLNRYRILIVIGCILGYFVSFVIDLILLTHIKETFGSQKLNILNFILPILFIIIVYFIDISLCKKIMKYIKKVSVIDTIRGSINITNGKKKNSVKTSHVSSKFMTANVWSSWKAIIANKKSWFLLTFVVMIAECIMLTASNVLNTFKSPEFITYMGQSKCDVMLSVSATDNLNEKFKTVMNYLSSDESVDNMMCEAYITRSAINKDGEIKNIHIACSETSNTSLQYLEGRPSENADEIALSLLNSQEFGVETGDYLKFISNGVEKNVFVSGVYQDVTNGGYTSKMCSDYTTDEVYQYYIMVDLNKGTDVEAKANLYSSELGANANVKSMEEFVNQTLSGLTSQFESVLWIIVIMSISLVALITVLYLMLMLIKNRTQIAIQKVIGFSVMDIRCQYIYKTFLCSLIGALIGILLVQTIGERAVSMILGMVGMGISKITFIINPLQVFIIFPFILLLTILIVSYLCTAKIKNDKQLSQLIKG